MKFSCERALLHAAIGTVARAVASKTSIPALEGILIEADSDLRLTGYNLETGIRTALSADVRIGGAAVLSARLFGEMIRKMPDDTVQFHFEDGTAHITCGNSEFHIQYLPPDEFPELPTVEDGTSFKLEQETLRTMISQTLFAVASQDARPVHTGSLFSVEDNALTIVSLDGYRLALRREPLADGGGECSFVVPGNALSEVEKLCAGGEEPITVMQGARHILFRLEQTILITRRLEGDFLNYKQSIPRQNQVKLAVQTGELIACIERVSLILSDKIKSPLRCRIGKNILFITTRSTTGSAADQCMIEGDGDDLEIGFDHRFLSDALKAAPADRVRLELGTNVSPCVILPEEGDHFLYLVLPVRLKPGE